VIACLAGCTDSSSAPAPPTSVTSHTTRAVPRPVRKQRIVIGASNLNYAFRPYHLTTRRGGLVTWVNQTTADHTVTATHPSLFDVNVAAQTAVTLRFTRVGTFRYYCRFHPYMRGVIMVMP
jgi:plastocyanin